MAQLDETIQQAWVGMSAQERGNCSGAYSAWNSLKLAYDATTVVSVVRVGIASIKYLTGLLRLNRSFSRFVTGGKAIYNAVKSRTLSAPMGRMGARMERYVEWGRRRLNPKNIREASYSWTKEKQNRFKLADDFYNSVGFKDYDNHLRGIDFNQEVSVVNINKESKLDQYCYINPDGSP